MALLDDLQRLRTRLRNLSQQFDSRGDLVSSARIDRAVLSIEDAIRVAQARDIIAGLPSDADARKAATMLGRMGAVAANLDADQARVTQVVALATDVANIVSDLALGNYGAAASAATDFAAGLA